MVESQGSKRQDAVYSLSCNNINQLYPWSDIPQTLENLEHEDCRYGQQFDPIVDKNISFTCGPREYLASVVRLFGTNIQLGCCKLRTRDEMNCKTHRFGKPYGSEVRTEIELNAKLINALSVEGNTYLVRFCDLTPRASSDILEEARSTTTRKPTPATTATVTSTTQSTTEKATTQKVDEQKQQVHKPTPEEKSDLPDGQPIDMLKTLLIPKEKQPKDDSVLVHNSRPLRPIHGSPNLALHDGGDESSSTTVKPKKNKAMKVPATTMRVILESTTEDITTETTEGAIEAAERATETTEVATESKSSTGAKKSESTTEVSETNTQVTEKTSELSHSTTEATENDSEAAKQTTQSSDDNTSESEATQPSSVPKESKNSLPKMMFKKVDENDNEEDATEATSQIPLHRGHFERQQVTPEVVTATMGRTDATEASTLVESSSTEKTTSESEGKSKTKVETESTSTSEAQQEVTSESEATEQSSPTTTSSESTKTVEKSQTEQETESTSESTTESSKPTKKIAIHEHDARDEIPKPQEFAVQGVKTINKIKSPKASLADNDELTEDEKKEADSLMKSLMGIMDAEKALSEGRTPSEHEQREAERYLRERMNEMERKHFERLEQQQQEEEQQEAFEKEVKPDVAENRDFAEQVEIENKRVDEYTPEAPFDFGAFPSPPPNTELQTNIPQLPLRPQRPKSLMITEPVERSHTTSSFIEKEDNPPSYTDDKHNKPSEHTPSYVEEAGQEQEFVEDLSTTLKTRRPRPKPTTESPYLVAEDPVYLEQERIRQDRYYGRRLPLERGRHNGKVRGGRPSNLYIDEETETSPFDFGDIQEPAPLPSRYTPARHRHRLIVASQEDDQPSRRFNLNREEESVGPRTPFDPEVRRSPIPRIGAELTGFMELSEKPYLHAGSTNRRRQSKIHDNDYVKPLASVDEVQRASVGHVHDGNTMYSPDNNKPLEMSKMLEVVEQQDDQVEEITVPPKIFKKKVKKVIRRPRPVPLRVVDNDFLVPMTQNSEDGATTTVEQNESVNSKMTASGHKSSSDGYKVVPVEPVIPKRSSVSSVEELVAKQHVNQANGTTDDTHIHEEAPQDSEDFEEIKATEDTVANLRILKHPNHDDNEKRFEDINQQSSIDSSVSQIEKEHGTDSTLGSTKDSTESSTAASKDSTISGAHVTTMSTSSTEVEVTTPEEPSTTTLYDPKFFYQTPKIKRRQEKERYLTFCSKEMAIRDQDDMPVACGLDNEVWYPPRCPENTECFYTHDSFYRICCLNKSGKPVALPSHIPKDVLSHVKNIKQGSATRTYCAVHPDVSRVSGHYFADCWDDEDTLAKDLVNDRRLQDALWNKSISMIKDAGFQL
ncbi:unnamed protein product [Bursaphelenchus okinawaensis]|uniref:Uncharacterized protein n=1 Tax=Bursaphelenchus okinawaensis TaxID=465554 RepID=A0A811KG65_9BILA|nr:unnamed protein product [Bursaphelenchus okinawaensis]CAG9102498.1 unnamed protein product [Bursaphelenchus okinawaensis]